MKGGYRPGAGRPRGSLNKKRVETLSDIYADAAGEGMTPLEYMLMVMNDPKCPVDRRDRMAIAAAPFCHPRKGEGGLKTDAKEKARVAGEGRFRPAAPPVLKVLQQ